MRNVRKYGRFGIDLYIIADPFTKIVTLMSEPHAAGYGGGTKEIPYGESPVFTLATGERVEVDTSTFPSREA